MVTSKEKEGKTDKLNAIWTLDSKKTYKGVPIQRQHSRLTPEPEPEMSKTRYIRAMNIL